MRNYLALWLTDLNWKDPVTLNSGHELIWGRDEDEWSAAAGARTLNLSNAGFEVTINSSGKAFPMMDKAQLFALLQFCGTLGVAPATYAVDETPRNTWKPSEDDLTDNPGTGTAKSRDRWKTADKKIKLVAPETLLQSLQTFAGAIIAKGFATGGARYNPNKDRLLLALIPFITALNQKRAIDMPALDLLLSRINAYLS